jgi:arylsulfatase A-like enzyme
VDGSAMMPEGWSGPYAGFDHAELILFGHALRIAPLMGQWNWCFGPPPFGLHYARYLFRDGHDKGVERLRLMQPEAAGRTWDHTQTWANQLPEEDHPTTWVADRAIEWLGTVDEPFFAWVSFTDPHHPMDPPAPWSAMYSPADVGEVLWEPHPEEFDNKPAIHRLWSEGPGRNAPMAWANPGAASLTRHELATMVAGYYGMVSQLDANIGRVLAALDQRGMADDTLVVSTTDHGEFLGDHQMMFKGPIHYESLLRVPLIVRGPGFDPGAVVDEPVGTIDIAPTAMVAAGLPIPATVEGRPLLDGAREYALVENDHQMVATIRLRTVATHQYKLTRYLDTDANELYDLEADPLELVNRWDDPALAGVRDDLVALLAAATARPARREPMVGVVA